MKFNILCTFACLSLSFFSVPALAAQTTRAATTAAPAPHTADPSAESQVQIALSALGELQGLAPFYGLNLRLGYRFNSQDSIGLSARAEETQGDYLGFYGLSGHAGLNYRHEFPSATARGVAAFVGAALGVGLSTACVWEARCGGFGPYIGAEVGAKRPISQHFQIIAALAADARPNLWGGSEIVPLVTLRLGVEFRTGPL